MRLPSINAPDAESERCRRTWQHPRQAAASGSWKNRLCRLDCALLDQHPSASVSVTTDYSTRVKMSWVNIDRVVDIMVRSSHEENAGVKAWAI